MQYTIDGFFDSKYVRSHSVETIKTYKTCLKKFEEFLKHSYQCSLTDIIDQIKEKKIDVYEVLRDFVINQDRLGYSPRTVELRVNAAKEYLRYCGIKIYSEDFKQTVKLPRKIKAVEVPLTKEVILRVLRNVSPKLQAVILVATATGMRIGELVQLKISDIHFEVEPTKIHLRAETTKTRTPRVVFLTKESTQALKDYLGRYHNWDEKNQEQIKDKIVFGRTSISNNLYKKDSELKTHWVAAAETLLQKSLLRAIRKVADLNVKNSNQMQSIHFHAFRKFHRTIVGNAVGQDFAENMLGHSSAANIYYQLSEQEKIKLYLKAEPNLTISDFKTVEKSFEELSNKNQTLENKIENIMNYLKQNSLPVPTNVI